MHQWTNILAHTVKGCKEVHELFSGEQLMHWKIEIQTQQVVVGQFHKPNVAKCNGANILQIIENNNYFIHFQQQLRWNFATLILLTAMGSSICDVTLFSTIFDTPYLHAFGTYAEL
jgi:hypothetical protein